MLVERWLENVLKLSKKHIFNILNLVNPCQGIIGK